MIDSFYNAVDREEISKLPFLGKEVPYYFSSGSEPLVGGTVFRIDQADFDKASKRIKGVNYLIKPGSNVYVMYKNNVPKFKIEEHFKRIGCKIVKDYRKADVILGSSNMIKDMWDKLQCATSLIFKAPSWYSITPPKDKLPLEYTGKFEPRMTESLKFYNPELLPPIEGIYHSDVWKPIEESKVETVFLNNTGNCYMTPLGVSMMYWILKTNIPIVSEESFASQIEGSIILDEFSTENILKMLSSKSNDDQNLGDEVLANCDINKSLYWIFKISERHPYRYQTSTNKNVRSFADNSGYNQIARMTESEFAYHMLKKDLLTQEILDKLIPAMIESMEGDICSDVFDITLTPKKVFSDFTINDQFINIPKETQDED